MFTPAHRMMMGGGVPDAIQFLVSTIQPDSYYKLDETTYTNGATAFDAMGNQNLQHYSPGSTKNSYTALHGTIADGSKESWGAGAGIKSVEGQEVWTTDNRTALTMGCVLKFITNLNDLQEVMEQHPNSVTGRGQQKLEINASTGAMRLTVQLGTYVDDSTLPADFAEVRFDASIPGYSFDAATIYDIAVNWSSTAATSADCTFVVDGVEISSTLTVNSGSYDIGDVLLKGDQTRFPGRNSGSREITYDDVWFKDTRVAVATLQEYHSKLEELP